MVSSMGPTSSGERGLGESVSDSGGVSGSRPPPLLWVVLLDTSNKLDDSTENAYAEAGASMPKVGT